MGNEVGIQSNQTEEALLISPAQDQHFFNEAKLPQVLMPESAQYVHTHADGTIERAVDSLDAVKRCPVLGKIAIEAPDDVEVLLALSALGEAKIAADNNSKPNTPKSIEVVDKDHSIKKPVVVDIKEKVTELTEQPNKSILDQQMNITAFEKLDLDYRDLSANQVENIQIEVRQKQMKLPKNVVALPPYQNKKIIDNTSKTKITVRKTILPQPPLRKTPQFKYVADTILPIQHMIESSLKPQEVEAFQFNPQITIPHTVFNVKVFKIYPETSKSEPVVHINENKHALTKESNINNRDTLPVEEINKEPINSTNTMAEPYDAFYQSLYEPLATATDTAASLFDQEVTDNVDEQDILLIGHDITEIGQLFPDIQTENEFTVVGIVESISEDSDDITEQERLEILEDVVADSTMIDSVAEKQLEQPSIMSEITKDADTKPLDQMLDQIEQYVIEPNVLAFDTEFKACMHSIYKLLQIVESTNIDTTSKSQSEFNKKITVLIIDLLQIIGYTIPQEALQNYTNLYGSESLLQRLESIHQRYAGDAKLEGTSLSVHNPLTTNKTIPVRFGKTLIKLLTGARH